MEATSNDEPLLDGAAKSSPEVFSVCTVAATAVATGHLMLKIEGYSRLKVTHGENGSYIESCAFMIGGHSWKIRCYLNGYSIKDSGFLSLYLYLCSDSVALAEYELALVPPHQAAGSPPAAYGHPMSMRSQCVRTFRDKDINYARGCRRFISVEELERSSFLKDDCFAVRCTVTVVEERTVKDEAVQAHDMARMRMGMLFNCDDELCKRHHARPEEETFLQRFANFCCSICRGPVKIKSG